MIYLPTFTIKINHSCIGKYTRPMDPMGIINPLPEGLRPFPLDSRIPLTIHYLFWGDQFGGYRGRYKIAYPLVN